MCVCVCVHVCVCVYVCVGEVDYEALIRAIDNMDPTDFASVDMDRLVSQYTR